MMILYKSNFVLSYPKQGYVIVSNVWTHIDLKTPI